jgi:hypothetical protein
LRIEEKAENSGVRRQKKVRAESCKLRDYGWNGGMME